MARVMLYIPFVIAITLCCDPFLLSGPRLESYQGSCPTIRIRKGTSGVPSSSERLKDNFRLPPLTFRNPKGGDYEPNFVEMWEFGIITYAKAAKVDGILSLIFIFGQMIGNICR
jgi:hypothetical protein